jgi:DNA-binding response OmpR family regulator
VKSVHIETDLDKALAYARVRPVDLLVVDHVPKAGTGLDIVGQFRDPALSPCPRVPVLYVSPDAGRAHIEAARVAGVDQFCVKPVQAGVLAARLEWFVKRAAAA